MYIYRNYYEKICKLLQSKISSTSWNMAPIACPRLSNGPLLLCPVAAALPAYVLVCWHCWLRALLLQALPWLLQLTRGALANFAVDVDSW
jgi:hypothetical protein